MPFHFTSCCRREFIKRSLAGGAAVLAARAGFGAEQGEERWALLSDTHIAGDQAVVSRGVNMAEHLRQVVGEVQALAHAGTNQVLVNGDLSLDHAEPADYATFLELTQALRAAGQALHCLVGNHDGREAFWEALKSEGAQARPVEGKHLSVLESGVANWYLLDSLVKTLYTPGELGAQQLEWLAAALDARPDKPALVMVHHDFIPRTDGKTPGLLDTEKLLEVVKPRKQVKALFCGHTHKWRVAEEAGIHLVNLPAVAYPFNPAEATGWVDCRLKNDGMRLELSATDKAHALHGKVTDLAWRG